MNLLNEMTRLVETVRRYVKDWKGSEGDLHHSVCVAVANAFDLWEADTNCFPIWLSRIVEGEMRDLGIGIGGAE